MILALLPDLFGLVQRNHNSEVIYLIIKIIWKTVHYEISDEVRRALCGGMELIITVFGAVNPQFENDFN